MFFRYILRNLIARRASTVPTALAIIATVAAITAMLSLLEGLYAALYESGHPQTAVVLAKTANDELSSQVPLTVIKEVEVAPGIASSGTTPQVSGEFVTSYRFRVPGRGFEAVTIRGVQATAFQIHPDVKVVGRFPAPGESGVVIGVRRAGTLEGFTTGGKVHIGRTDWPVLGVLEAPGTVFESEIWCDRQALAAELRRETTVSVIYARLQDERSLTALTESLGRNQTNRLKVVSEREYYRQSYRSVEFFARSIVIMTIVLALGATFAAINAMYTAFLGRLPELATLVAIGYTKRRISMLLVQENLFLAGLCGLIGLGLAFLMNGRSMSFEATALVYSARITPRVIAGAALTTGVIAVSSGTVALVHAYRIRVLDALRSL